MEKSEILDTSVAIDRHEGYITTFTAIEYPPCLHRQFQIISPETIDYVKAIHIANRLRSAGRPIGAIDILIAAMCINREATLVTKDGDFETIKKEFPELQLKKGQ